MYCHGVMVFLSNLQIPTHLSMKYELISNAKI